MQRIILLAMALGGYAVPCIAATAVATVDVYFSSEVNLPPGMEFIARAQASQRFAEIGVRLVWHTTYPPSSIPDPQAIAVAVLAAAPASMRDPAHRFALGSARPYASGGTRICVYYDRLQAYTLPFRSRAANVFGHVLAHEIAHVLQGIARHSSTGIMRAEWSTADRADILRGRLRFAREDAELVLAGIQAQEQERTTLARNYAVR